MASKDETRCPKCNQIFDSRSAMEAHCRDKHSPQRSLSSPGIQPAAGSFPCRCGKPFPNEQQLQQHSLNKGSKRFGCGYCCESFDSEDDREKHLKKKHPTEDGSRKTLQTGISLKPEAVNESSRNLDLSDHLAKIFSTQTVAPFRCPCGKDYQEIDKFKQHLMDKDKTAKAYKCKVCCEAYSSDQALKDHTRVKHIGGRDNADHPQVANAECFPCIHCSKIFESSEHLQSHIQRKHDLNNLSDSFQELKINNNVSSNGVSDEGKRLERKPWKCDCGRTFEQEVHLIQHRAAKKEKAKLYPCQLCCHSFENEKSLDAHMTSQHNGVFPKDGNTFQLPRSHPSSNSLPPAKRTFRCLQCDREFSSLNALLAHEKEKSHDNSDVRGDVHKSLTRYLETLYKTKSAVKPEDKDASYELVRSRIIKILSVVNKQEDGRIFKCELRNAGSNATELKIGKADEFDFNIPVDVKVLEVKQTGTVPYIFKDKEKQMGNGPSPKNMNVKRELKYEPGGKYPVPKDYAVLVVDTSTSPTLKNLCVENHLIAHHLQQRLYACIKKAIEGMKDIDLNAEAHGPAITMTMHPQGGHQISVDLTVVIDWKYITVNEYRWPRPETDKHLSKKVIETILASGCQLTPKGDEFWNISFSNCESFLMKEIDGPNECRKMCHKLLKTFFHLWKSRSRTGYKTISSYIFKHLTFWMSEKKVEPGYWNQSNLSTCFLDTLKELLKNLNSKKLINYFIPNENILGIRDLEEVKELTEEVKKEICELENITC